MRKFRRAAILLLAAVLCLAAGCTNKKNMPGQSKTPASAESELTLLIYMCGSDLETKYGAATDNIEEMLQTELPADTNILIETGGAHKWRNYGISSTELQRYAVEDGALKLKASLGDASMGDAATLKDFISWGTGNCPAQQYGLILWDHGGGSVNGVCFDENHSRDGLTLLEIAAALSGASLPQRFDFIGFDACLMATIETALTIEPYANNMIASQDKEPNGGWDYRTLVSHLGKDDFYDAMMSSYAEKSREKEFYTLSHTDLSKLDSVLDGFNELIKRMEAETRPRAVIGAYIGAAKFGSEISDYYDLGNLLSQYGIDGGLEECVACVNGAFRQGATGLSVYFPLANQDDLQSYYTCNPYEAYSDYIKAFFADREQERISFLSYAEQKDDMLCFRLSPDSVQYIGQIDYVLYALHVNGPMQKVYALGNDNDAELDENTVTIRFEGRWVEFGGHLLNCSISDVQDGYATYQAPIRLNDESALLMFSHDMADGSIHIIGATYESEGFSRIHELKSGDRIIGVTKDVTSGQTEQLYPAENAFTYKTSTAINIVTLPDGYYQYTAFVTDVYGKRYSAGTAVVKMENGTLSIEAITGDEVTYPD